MQAAADCLLAVLGQLPDDASETARAGAIMLVDYMALQSTFVKGIAKAFGGKSPTPSSRRSRIRR